MSTITRERVANLLQFNSEGSDCQSNAEQWEVHELARIALASLEADAVAYVDPFAFHNFSVYRAGETDNKRMGREWMWANPDAGLIPVYTAPPAPVSVPDAMEMDDDFDSAFEHGKAVGWNAYRAAILQRAEPVQGWIPCSDRMPTKNHRVLIFINFNSDTVPPSIHDAQFTGSTFRRGNATVNVFPLEDGYGVTHWMPLPAAPQQGA
ncbi:TPA: DUF551 domain-containing protein [Enterobacter asburiae]|nr:DUF551 domain-containing protein [Enterobacter asburiae]